MNLQDLVPPLELCKLIPKGEFEDSYYVRGFMVISLHGYGVDFLVTREELEELKKDNTIDEYYPAPTLQEILEELPWDFEFSRCYEDNVPTEKYITIIGTEIGEVGNNGVESAMKTWLKYKGIK